MSDFDQFTGSVPPEDDPAADFLAREQDQFAQLDDVDAGFDDATTGVTGQTASDMFSTEPPAADFTSAVEGEADQPPADFSEQQNDFSFDPISDVTDREPSPRPSDPYGAVKMQDAEREVPEKIQRWRAEQEERLALKDEESEIRKREWREIAAKELEDWYKHRDEQLEKTRLSNREAEASFVHERDEKIPGQQWEKVCRSCDFNPKSSRTTKDVSRMRSILLQLKQTPLTRS